MIDVKGDLPNLLYAFPTFAASAFEPWVEPGPGDVRSNVELAAARALERQEALTSWGVDEVALAAFADAITYA